jgi:glucose-6-phosphate 1-epimerase
VTGQGSATTVLWNPWVDKAAALADLGDDEWTRMVCVETCNVGPAAVTVPAGSAHAMTALLGVATRVGDVGEADVGDGRADLGGRG